MNPRLVLLSLFAAGVVNAEDKPNDEGVFEPGVQHVCVPTADGEGWDCGTAEAPPADYKTPAAEPAAAPAPSSTPEPATVEPAAQPAAVAEPEPVAVADTAAISDDASTPAPPPFLADPMRNTPYAPVEQTSPEPANAAEAVIAVEEAAPSEPADVAASAPTPIAEPEAPAAVAPTPAPVAEPVAAATAPTPAPTTAAPLPSASALGDAGDFAQLPATAFTLQLAYAASTADFPRLVAELGLDPASCYALRVRGANGPTWLLAHGAFADVNAARAAQAALPKAAGLSAQWPRRIGALQTEHTQGL